MSAQAGSPMTENQRLFPRKDLQIDIELSILDEFSCTAKTRDISEGGMFIQLDDIDNFPIGEMVFVRYQDPFQNDAETEKDGVIVRLEKNGIAIAFVEIDSF